MPSNLGKIDQPLRVLGPTAALCEMRPLYQERAMCERKAKKDAPAAVVSRAACVSRAPPADASRLALSGWGRPPWSLRVNLLTMYLLKTCSSNFVFFNLRVFIKE